MSPPFYLFRRSKLRFSSAVWPVGVRGWCFLLACNLVFLLGMIAAVKMPFGVWTIPVAGLVLLAIAALFAGMTRYTDWTYTPPSS